MKRVYVAGTVTLSDYRTKISSYKLNNIVFLDPLKNCEPIYKQYNIDVSKITQPLRTIPEEAGEKIVESDKDLIDSCSILLAYMEKPTVGTCMEILYAFESYKKIYVIAANSNLKTDIWLRYHVNKFFDSIEQFIDFIKDEK